MLKMISFNRIDVSKEIDVDQKSTSNESDICHY